MTDKTVINLENENMMLSGFDFESGVSSPESFDIGSAIIDQFTVVLDNSEEQYSRYDFIDAVIIPRIGLELDDGTKEMFQKGVYVIESATSQGSTIKIKALDNMVKLEKEYETALVFPATLDQIVRDICSRCDVLLNSYTFDNQSFSVKTKPAEMTFREVLYYCSQIAGCYAHFNARGQLELGWYDFSVFDTADHLDGGNLRDYSTGDRADGGNFLDYSSGDVIDAGEGFSDMRLYHHIYALSSQQISTDDVVITGIKVIAEQETEEGLTEIEFISGADGYVLTVEKNPLISIGQAQGVADFLGKKIIGTRFRPLSVSAQSDPSIEAGDAAYVSDHKGNTYPCVITNLSLSVGGWESFSCDAKPAGRNRAEQYSASTRAVVQARKEIQKERTEREKMTEDLNNRLDNASGLFYTKELQEDGSTISYAHDKPNLSDSMVIIKFTAEAIGISNDGGKTYPYGIELNGDTIVRILSAVGIDADWITAGTIQSRDGSSYWDLDNGRINISGTFRQFSSSGKPSVAISGNSVKVYNWAREGEEIGGLLSLYQSGTNYGIASLSAKRGQQAAICTENSDGTFTKCIEVSDVSGDDPISFRKETHFKQPVHFKQPFYLGDKARSNHYSSDGTGGFSVAKHFAIWDWSGSTIMAMRTNRIDCYQTVYANVSSWSDERLKKFIRECAVCASDIIDQLYFVEFDWLESGQHESVGLIAQDVNLIDDSLGYEDQDGTYSINDTRLLRVLAKASQEQNQRIKSLEDRIADLEAAIGKKQAAKQAAPIKKEKCKSRYSYEEKRKFVRQFQKRRQENGGKPIGDTAQKGAGEKLRPG